VVGASRLALMVVGACVLLTGLPVPQAAATFPGANGRIAYARINNINDDIVAIDPDGSHNTNLTNDGALDDGPAWSPDGRQIAYARGEFLSDVFRIFKMNADGSAKTQLTHLPGISVGPSWSPDGSRIVFLYDENNDGSSEIYVMDADGSDVSPVTSTGTDHGSVKWSPDGARIAFSMQATGDRSSDYDLYTSRPDGSDLRRVAALPDDQWGPDWSPDGTGLVFVTHRLVGQPRVEERPLYTIKAVGSGLARVGTADGYGPVWSPDGTRIAYSAWTYMPYPPYPDRETLRVDIATVRPDGSDFRYLVSDRVPGGIEPSWQPLRRSTTKDQCKNGGWRSYPGFENQGDCVSFVATGGKNPPGK
jgi:Tol biopolymer transport system component